MKHKKQYKKTKKAIQMKRERNLTIRLSEEEYNKIEKIAEKIDIPKTRLARNLIISGLKDAELLEKLGFFKVAEIIQKIQREAIKEEKHIKELITN
jgi:predicted transcriptional regulator